MATHIHIHLHQNDNKEVLEQLLLITKNQQTIMDDQQQAVADLQGISAQLKKIGTESSASLEKITALEQAANNQPGLTQELKDAIADVKAQAQVVDDLVPDATGTTDTGSTDQGTTTDGTTGTTTDENSGAATDASAAPEGLEFGTGLPK